MDYDTDILGFVGAYLADLNRNQAVQMTSVSNPPSFDVHVGDKYAGAYSMQTQDIDDTAVELGSEMNTIDIDIMDTVTNTSHFSYSSNRFFFDALEFPVADKVE